MNKVILSGYIGKEIKTGSSENGYPYALFSLAVRKNYTQIKENEWANEFYDIVAFRKTAEYVEKVGPGAKIIVSGRIQIREYTNKNGDNVRRYEIVADDIEAVSPKSDDRNDYTTEKETKIQGPIEVDTSDDVPF